MRRADRTLVSLCCAGLLAAAPVVAANFVIVNQDGPGEGLNDPTPVAPVPGNPGTTLGQQRRNVFNAAGGRWGSHLRSTIDVRVGVQFNNLTCTPSSAVLGSAGPNSAHRDFVNAPVANTWYVQAVANSRANVDLAVGTDDISAQFNSRLDDGDPGCLGGTSWWYGIGSPAPAGTVDLFTTVLHELAHGNGFLSLHDSSTGEKFLGFNDAYLRLIFDEFTNEGWAAMTNAERLASQVRTGQLVWTGAQATAKVPGFNAGINNGHLRLFAPNPFQPGSSVSHWDTVVAPNELQEPILTATAEDYVTYALMGDIGWRRLIIFKDSFESADDDFWSPHP